MNKTHRSVLLATSALILALGVAQPAFAAGRDSDRDGIPNRWERTHGLNPHKRADARADLDRDGLNNRVEYRLHSGIRDEDTDNDGHDDGDEVRDGTASTRILDRDTDDDGRLDGDEDSDHDGTANEDEDDATEGCLADDDDRDRDSVSDEDENELGLRVGDRDSDDDGRLDGAEDRDRDGEANEDEDDSLEDRCDHDAEDTDDLLGSIASFDAVTGALVVTTVNGFTVTGTVTADTEIDVEDSSTAGSPADLVPGVQVAELEFDDDSGLLEEVSIYPAP